MKKIGSFLFVWFLMVRVFVNAQNVTLSGPPSLKLYAITGNPSSILNANVGELALQSTGGLGYLWQKVSNSGPNNGWVLILNSNTPIPSNFWSANGSNISNNNMGNVGIGITNPTAKFQDNGSFLNISNNVWIMQNHAVSPSIGIGYSRNAINCFFQVDTETSGISCRLFYNDGTNNNMFKITPTDIKMQAGPNNTPWNWAGLTSGGFILTAPDTSNGTNLLNVTSANGSFNYLTISDAGKMTVGGNEGPTLRLATGNQAAGKVFTSDANGLGDWLVPALPDTTIIATKAYVQNSITALKVNSGIYLPTFTGTANVASVSGDTAQWMQVGNVVTVSGSFSVSATTIVANPVTTFDITLPVVSTIQRTGMVGGNATNAAIQSQDGEITGNTGNNKATVTYFALIAGSTTWSYQYQYLVR